ncbi:MAG TPA: hypothetical protein VFA63_06745 [Pseudonocardiaceae bacterium]|nr:hypothetical protein [Pseudonocardiaceae bacterium]
MDHTTDHNMHQHIAAAADALAATGAHIPQRLSAEQLLVALSDLASIAGLLGELATRTRHQLAAWATVGAHLNQAEQHAADLRRSLNHACATFAFSNHPTTAA